MCIDPMRVVIKLDISWGKEKEKETDSGIYCIKSLCNFVCCFFLMFKASYDNIMSCHIISFLLFLLLFYITKGKNIL